MSCLPSDSAAALSSPGTSELYSKVAKAQYNGGLEFLKDHMDDIVKSFKSAGSPDGTFYVLDFGCGSCPFFEIFNTFPFQKVVVVGVDPDKNRLELARQKFSSQVQDGILMLVHANDETLLQALKADASIPSKFHLVFSNYVIMWIKEKSRCLSNLIELTKDNGLLMFAAVESPDKEGTLPNLMDQMKPREGIASESDIKDMKRRALGSMHFQKWATIREDLEAYRKDKDYQVVSVNQGEHVHSYQSLEELCTWWAATMHGNFDASLIPEEPEMRMLREKFPSGVTIIEQRHRVVIAKTSKSTAGKLA